MSRKQAKVQNKAKATKTRRKRANNGRPTVPAAYKHVVNQLIDPCGAMPFSPYQGERGVVQRFVQDATYATPGHTCGYVVFSPAANSTVVFSAVNPGTPGSPAFFVGPGAPYLTSSASKIRSCGACVTTMPSAVSITNMTGELGMAIVTTSQLSTLGTYTVDGVFQLTNIRKVLRKNEFETKWFPGSLDHTYAPVLTSGGAAGTASLSDPSDQNAILVAWRGYPAGVGLSFRYTNILEWTPTPGLGVSVTSAPSAGLPVAAIAAATHKAEPSWWHTHSKEIKQALGDAGAKLLASGIQAAAEYGSDAMVAAAA